MELVYKPSSEDHIVNNVKALSDFEGTDPEKLIIFQCPITRFVDNDVWNDVEVMVAEDMISGRFEASGKEVDLVSSASQDADVIVFLPSEQGSTIVTKARQVSLVRYPEPKELLETMKAKTRQKLVGAVTDSSGKTDPTRSSRHESGKSVRHSASTRSSIQKSMFSGHTETPKSSKRKHSESSGKHWSSTSTVSGSSGKSKKKLKKEE